MKKKILISGSFGTGNIGDELILEVVLKLLEEHDIKVLSQGIEYTKENFPQAKTIHQTPNLHPIRIIKDLIKLRFNNISKRIQFIVAVYKCDIFWLGGGGLLSDFSKSVLPYYLSQIKIAKLFKKRIYLVGIGVGPVRFEKSKHALFSVLSDCIELINVRDQSSLRILKDCGLKNKIILSPDLAFRYNIPEKPEQKTKALKKVIFNFYDLFNDENTWKGQTYRSEIHGKKISKIIEKLLEKGYEVELLPFGTENDSKFAHKIHQALRSPRCTLFESSKYTDVVKRYQEASFSLTMRFHAGLLSFLSGTPSICIDQQGKTEKLLKDMDLEILLEVIGDGINRDFHKDIDVDNIQSQISFVENNSVELRKKIKQYTQEQKIKSNQMIKRYIDI